MLILMILKDEEKVIFRKENIGFIFQNNQLLEDFNVEENVALPLLMNGNSFRKSISKANDYLIFLEFLTEISLNQVYYQVASSKELL